MGHEYLPLLHYALCVRDRKQITYFCVERGPLALPKTVIH